MKCPSCQHANPPDTSFCGKCGTSLKKPKKKAAAPTRTLKMPLGELAPGMDFARRYQIIEDLGKGGMGHVYKALDREIKEVVALKTLKPGLLEDEEIVERFHNELKLARRISHRNVCGLYHLSKDENDTFYITMEYVSGEDLKSLIRRVGQLSIGKAIFIGGQICDGLAEAHRLNVVHRDLKPQNVMIDREGHVRIMDFGIARSLAMKGPTDPGSVIGTPDYMSPEQIEGKDIDRRTDIYALGVILYEMLTGHLPFEGPSPLAVAVKQKSMSPASPKRYNPHIPDSLIHAILKCLEKRREKRFDDVTALRDELARIGEALHLTSGAPPKRSITRKITRVVSYRPRWMYAAVAVFVLIGGFIALNPGLLHRARGYDNYISLEVAGSGPGRVWLRPVEFVLNRALSASVRKYIFVHEDLLTYKKRTKSEASAFRPAELGIVADIVPKVMGFDISLTTRFRGRTSHQTFDCKGQLDFLTQRADDILRYLSDLTGGLIAPPQPGRAVSRILTANIDALEHFLGGEEAWTRLKSDQAFYEFRTALENDPSFALAHLRLVEVLIFRLDLEAARTHLERALGEADRLTDLDLLRLRALQARLDSKPNEERQFLRKLTEEFPFKKEYHYEFAESYFHYGAADEAIRHYLKALELDGDYALAHNHIAYCYSWIGQHDQALAHLRKYQTLDPTANSFDSLAAGYMYAGDCAQALSVVRDGLKVDPKLDFLYLNQLHNHILLGQLVQGREAIRQQAVVTTREVAKNSVGFWYAFVELLKGDLRGARRALIPSLEAFRQEAYRDRLDESPNSASWLAGVIAARSGDLKGLEKEIAWMEGKIARHSVSATNFSPIWKFYVHLKVLSGALKRDQGEVLRYVEEGRLLRTKMGYWGSFFNLAYFNNLFAEALLVLPGSHTSGVLLEAKSLLDEASSYNSRYAWTHLNLARLYLEQGNREGVRTECSLAKDILSGSDPDYVLIKALLEIEARLTD